MKNSGRNCSFCDAELPTGASFCPYCAKVLIEKKKPDIPKPWRRHMFAVISCLVLALAAAGVIQIRLDAALRRQRAENETAAAALTELTQELDALTYEPLPQETDAAADETPAPEAEEKEEKISGTLYDSGNAEIVYPVGDVRYHVLLSAGDGSRIRRDALHTTQITISSVQHASFPSQLFIYQENSDEDVQDIFMDLVESYAVETVPEDGAAAMAFSTPRYEESFPAAARMTDVEYGAENGTNEIIWTLNMKNGDVIRLHQRVYVTERKLVRYTEADAPMQTVADLEALFEKIEREVDPETTVQIFLPAVTYTEPLYMNGRAYMLVGSRSGGAQTTFTDTVYVGADLPETPEISNVSFTGNGGVGIHATAGVTADRCTFTGWDIALLGEDGSWPMFGGCVFENNGVGVKFDTSYSSAAGETYGDNVFRDNGTAILIARLHDLKVLKFPNCVFSGNGVNLDNPAEHPATLDGAAIE